MPHCSVGRINGLPPKKDGANSMWNKKNEIPRLINLRKKVLAKVGIGRQLVRNISLVLDIHVGPRTNANVGDLDNFITGICDGLQKAHGNTNLSAWDDLDPDIHPSNIIAIEDDREVISIVAKKIFDDEDPNPWYSIKLTGE
jgi:hypothetical protein